MAAVNEILDKLEADPADASVRVRRYSVGMWGVPLHSRHDEWLLLWEPHPTEQGAVLIQYLGPDI